MSLLLEVPNALRTFPAERVLLADEDLLVVDKPWGLATHPPEEGRKDDVVSWLTEHFAARQESTYLGIHQRLDRETSGVLLFSRNKERNRALAEQFEGRRVDKAYLAVVEGRVFERMSLEHELEKGEGGTMVARDPATKRRAGAPSGGRSPSKRRAGLLARTELRLVERRGKRALVELMIETGRTHQIRAQLAAIGAPIVGDTRYGGPPGHRPLLHARTLRLTHPGTGQPLALEAPVPNDLRRGLLQVQPSYDDAADVHGRLLDAARRRFGVVAQGGGTNALRIANGAGDELPDLSVELFREHGVLSLYREFEAHELECVTSGLLQMGIRGVYVKHRPKVASRIVDSRRDDIAPSAPIAGSAAEPSFLVREDGIDYEVRLGDGLSTGLFLDQRENRRRVRELATGKRVLNLFCYTGSFSVAAAAGGAFETTSVDVSTNALEWTLRNLARAGFEGEAHRVVSQDASKFLGRAARKGERFDLIVLDPPSFSSTREGTFTVERDYAPLAARCLELLAPGGVLFASTNHRATSEDRFRKILFDAGRAAGRAIAKIRSYGPASDFPPEPGRVPHLKSAFVTLAD